MRIWIFIVTFFYVLGPVPKTQYGLYFDSIFLISVILTFYGVFIKRIYLTQNVNQIRILLILFLIYTLIVSLPLAIVLHERTFLFRDFIRPIRTFLTFFGGVVLVDIYRREYGLKQEEKIFRNISLIIFFNALLIISESFSYPLRQMLNSLFFRSISEIHWQTEMRAGGLMLSGGSMASALIGFGILSTSILYFNKHINLILYIISILIFFSAISFTGRTGLIFFLAIPFLIKHQKIKAMLQLILVFSSIILLWLAFQELITSNLLYLNDNITFNVNRVSATFNRYFGMNYNTAFVDDGIENILLSKFSLPESTMVLLFGDIGFSNLSFSKVSDMGFNISLYKYGLLGSLLYYLPLFGVVLYTIPKKKQKMEYEYLIFLLMFIVIEFKESVLYSRNLASIMFLIFLISQLKYNTIKNRIVN